jgi:hypothetical protein
MHSGIKKSVMVYSKYETERDTHVMAWRAAAPSSGAHILIHARGHIKM